VDQHLAACEIREDRGQSIFATAVSVLQASADGVPSSSRMTVPQQQAAMRWNMI